MRIDSLSIYRFETKLASPWITAYGADYTVEQVLFCLRSGGVEGWGEASPLNLPTYSLDYCWQCINAQSCRWHNDRKGGQWLCPH